MTGGKDNGRLLDTSGRLENQAADQSNLARNSIAYNANAQFQGVDLITVLTAEPRFRMGKLWKADGTIEGYTEGALLFEHSEVAVSGIDQLSRLLSQLQEDHRAYVVPGKYVGHDIAAPILQSEKAWRSGYILRRKEVLKDRARHATMFDVDGFETLFYDPVLEPVEAVREFIDASLPACFHDVSFQWQLSGSAGASKHAGKLKAHIWFWTDKPYTNEQMKRWAQVHAPAVDTSVFTVNQPLWTAGPTFEDGVHDPVPVRSGLWRGARDDVPLVLSADIMRPVAPIRDDVHARAVANDPVAQRLYELGMVDRVIGSGPAKGALVVECPRKTEHSTSDAKGGTSTVYFLANTGGYRQGIFDCKHEHCREQPQRLFTEALGLSETSAEGFDDVDGDAGEAWSDVAVARHAARLLAEGNFLYEHGARGWMRYDHGVYVPCTRGEETELVKRLGPDMVKSVPSDPDEFKKRMAMATRAMSLPGIRAALQLAQSDERIAVAPTSFDDDPDALNVLNGWVHLPTGGLRPHDPSKRFSRQCPFEYDPTCPTPIFERFLAEISCDDPDWTDFLHRAAGYSLSGRVNEEVMFFLLGSGANGKSVLCNVIRRVLGSYVTALPANILMQTNRDGEAATPALASLPGVRIAQLNEVEAGARLSARTVKEMTSVDAISARHLYGKLFNYNPSHTPWVRGNHKPIIADNDPGIWRRVVLIPFDRHFTAEEKDVGLEDAIMREAAGVLTWLVQGHLAYRQRGLRRTRRVEAASLAYRTESDLIGQWLDECAIRSPSAAWVQSEAYCSYRVWCSEQGLHPISKKTLTVGLAERGVTTGQETTGARLRTYRGIESANSCAFGSE